MPTLERQITGVIEDGSAEGAVRTRPARGDLVRWPFKIGEYRVEVAGGAAVTHVYGGTLTAGSAGGQGLSISVPSGLNPGARVWVPFYGRAFGVCWKRSTPNTAASDFSVSIDGEAFGVSGTETYMALEGLSLVTHDESAFIVTDTLNDGLHWAVITVVAHATAARTLILYGMLLDKAAGYFEPRRIAHATTTALLTNAQVEIVQNRTAENPSRGIRKIIYANVTAGAITVTVQQNPGSGAITVWSKSVPANDSLELDFGEPVRMDSSWTHAASANSSINATPIGVVD